MTLSLTACLLGTAFVGDADAQKEKGKKKAGMATGQQIFTLPKEITLTDDQKAKVEEIKKEHGPKLAELTKKIEELMKNRPGGTVVGEDPVVTALKADLVKAQTEVAESRALVDSLNKQKKEVEDKMVGLQQYKLATEKAIMLKGTTGRILAVNGGWNFVVLSIGDKQGAKMGATMLVVRGNEPIAKVRISSVEPSSSIADIIPGSVRRGVTVQPGDTVIFEGRTPATSPPPPDAAGLPLAPVLPLR